MDYIKNIAVLGATGSIGKQTLDIISGRPDRYKASVLVAGSKVDELISLAKLHRPKLAVIADETLYGRLHEALEGEGIATAAGSQAIADAVSIPEIDMVVTAVVGYSGLEPTIRAIKAGKDIALANKETLVVAGELINRLLKDSESKIYPVDSEHSAIYQCLMGESAEAVRRLIITASGGPFRTWDKDRMAKATVQDALRHPNWSMGAKITIDSATMLNKAFEIIEARWLFGMDPQKISAVVHPQSIVHSMVEFVDGAIKAQLGMPDMHLPIAFALGEASRLVSPARGLSIAQCPELTFEDPDSEKFPCLGLAYKALEAGGNTACVINAANEVAVASFLMGRIGFTDIYRIIMEALEKMPFVADPLYEDYVITNTETRRFAESLIQKA